MKLQNLGFAVLGLLMFQGAAFAEMISGTIAGIDPQAKKMTLVRSDNQNPLTLSVKDQAQLLGLQPGSRVVVDADRRFFGGWKVDSVTMADGPSAATEAQMNAGIPASASTAEASAPAMDAAGMESSRTLGGSAHPEDANPNLRSSDNNPNPTADTTY